MSLWAVGLGLVLAATPVDGNRLAYLDGHDIYYPHAKFPKLITPQWVGDAGVEAVVVLAIDDMRDTARYEAYLRPILQRLKAIDGRAPVSIMTCAVQPDDPQLQTWLQEGLSLEVHTFDHPCPLLQGPFTQAKGTYDKCVDLMFSIPNNTPVAYRMPCCDSLNTNSPRFYREIFHQTTPNGKFLQISSSVFQVYTADDPGIPRELLFDSDGKERFRKYFPKGLKRGDVTHDRFVNYVENYPYPYIIANRCWEFPCMTPSDWEANFLHQPNNPRTIEDLKAALDITVLKQGVLNLVFHPHGWIQAEQVNELIDHAVAKHGGKVKFLTFREALDRLNERLFAGSTLHELNDHGPQVTLRDLNLDGYLDLHIDQRSVVKSSRWDPASRRWLPLEEQPSGAAWQENRDSGVPAQIEIAVSTSDNGASRFETLSLQRDLDGDGMPELLRLVLGLRMSPDNSGIGRDFQIHRRSENRWEKLQTPLPPGWDLSEVTPQRFADAARFVDIDADGGLDFVYSDHHQYGVWLFESLETGWSTKILSGRRGDRPPEQELPPIIREDGTDNGFFVRDRALHWMNEDTAHLPNLIVSWDFDKLLGDRMPAAKTPNAAIESMRVRPGCAVELMAHEPLVMDPVAFQWGPDGKLWVAEMADYPQGMNGKGQPGGRIRFLEDTNADGVPDTSTLFLDGVPFPSGVHPWKNGVLISAAPDVFFAADTNGDGRADVREVLYTGFAEGNQQHRVNGFTWGLDGWLYLGNGDSGGEITSRKTGERVSLRGRDLKIQPETGAMVAISGQTQFGRARDDFDHWFGNNNSRPLWHYVHDERYLARNPYLPLTNVLDDVSEQPGNAPVFPASKTLTRFNDFHTANRFTSACGSIVTGEWSKVDGGGLRVRAHPPSASLPSTFDHQPSTLSFTSEPVHNLVHCEELSREGLRFHSRRLEDEQQSEFLASTDNWFRPTQLRVGPDGALWIADMYRLVIEHPQWIPQEWLERLDVRAGEDKGRLWRVAPNGTPIRAVPNLQAMSLSELVAALDTPNRWQRDMAQQLLVERDREAMVTVAEMGAAITSLEELAGSSVHPEVRVQALWTLRTLNQSRAEPLVAALKDPHPGVRSNAIRLLEPFAKTNPKLVRALYDISHDPDPWVQGQLLATAGELTGEDARRILVDLLIPTDDVDLRTLGLSSLTAEHLPPVLLFTALMNPELEESGHPLLEPLVRQTVAMEEVASLFTLGQLLLSDPPASTNAWRWGLVRVWVDSVRRRDEPWPTWQARVTQANPELGRLWTTWLAGLPAIINDPVVEPERRAEALRLYGLTTPNAAWDAAWLKPSQPLLVQRAAVELAGSLGSSAPAKAIVIGWRKLSPALRDAARQHLLGRPAIAQALLREVELTQLTPADIDPQTAQFLRTHRDAEVRRQAGDALPDADDSQRAALVAETLRTMPETGDATLGRELFAMRCAQCHKLDGLGHAVGPDLAALTDKSVTALVTAVLDPNRAVEAKFLQYGAETISGQVHTGLLTAESATSLTLLAAEAKAATLLRSELEDLWSVNKSLMPEGLEKELSPVDLANLVTFIRGHVPLPTRKVFAGNEPRRVTVDADGSLFIDPATAEIYGPTIVLEEPHGNLGWWSSADDFAQWTVDVPTSGRYRVELEYACHPDAAGHRFILQSRDGRVSYEVEPTADWETYATKPIGELDLSAGLQPLVAKPAERPLPALLDLKSVRLVPVD